MLSPPSRTAQVIVAPPRPASSWLYPAASALFFLSGIAALIYQVAWQRLLVIFAGGDIQAVTLIVTAFMLGLGLGNLGGGVMADRISRVRNLTLFGIAEGLIALFGAASKYLYYDGLYLGMGGGPSSRAATALILIGSLLAPTFLMGVSLPLLAKALIRDLEDAAPRIGTLYGVNTIGAALGAVLTTWLLLPCFGIEGAIRIAAGLNLLCALAVIPFALTLHKASPMAPPIKLAREQQTSAVTTTEPSWSVAECLCLAAATGFVALALEIVWFRLLGVMLKSTAFTFGTLLGIYLFGIGAGALAGTRLASKSPAPMTTFLLLQAVVGALAVLIPTLFLAAATHWPTLVTLHEYFGSYEPIDANTAVTLLKGWLSGAAAAEENARAWIFPALHVGLPLLIIGPPTVLMGLSFPFLQKAIQTDVTRLGRRVGWIQSANIAGSILGTVTMSFCALPMLGTALTLRGLAACGAGFALLAVIRRDPAGHGGWGPVAIPVLAVGLLALTPGQARLWAWIHGTTEGRIILAEDGAGVSLLKAAPAANGPTTVFVNGIGQSWIPYGGIHSVLGALPSLLHPAPEDIAVIGLGSGDTLFCAGARRETRKLVCIEIVGAQLETLRTHARTTPYPALRALLTDSRVEHIAGDGRLHLMTSGSRYDIIEADALRPTSAHSGTLYSEEYFRLVKSRLKPGGYAVTWSPTPRISATFLRVFPHVLVLDSIAIGSNEPISIPPGALDRRTADPAVRNYFRQAGLDPAALLNSFSSQLQTAVSIGPEYDRSTLPDVNTDVFPRDEFALPALWGHR